MTIPDTHLIVLLIYNLNTLITLLMYICAKVYTDLHIVMAELSFVNPPILPVRFIAHPSLPPDPYIPLLSNKCPAISENALTTPLTRVSS